VKSLDLSVLPQRFAVCQLRPDADLSFLDRLAVSRFWSITRTGKEVSVVMVEDLALPAWKTEKGWRCLQVRGPLAFDMTGVLASLVTPLAEAAISVFAISTYDTDYLLLRDADLPKAETVLAAHGHTIQRVRQDAANTDLCPELRGGAHKKDERP